MISLLLLETTVLSLFVVVVENIGVVELVLMAASVLVVVVDDEVDGF